MRKTISSVTNGLVGIVKDSRYHRWREVCIVMVVAGCIIQGVLWQPEWHYLPILMIGAASLLLALYNPFYGLIFWLFFTPFFENATREYGANIGKMVFYRALPPTLLACAAANAIVEGPKNYAFKLHKIDFYIAVFLCLAFYASIRCSDITYGIVWYFYDQFIVPIAIFYLVRMTLNLDTQTVWIALALVPLACFQAILGSCEFYTGKDFLTGRHNEWHISTKVLGAPALWRSSGSFTTGPEYGTVLGMVFFLLLYSALKLKNHLRVLYVWVGVIASLVCVTLSWTRSVWGGLVTGIGANAFFSWGRIWQMKLLLAGVVVFALLFLPRVAELPGFERIGSTSWIETRKATSSAQFSLIKEKPIFGWGASNIESELSNIAQKKRLVSGVSHNYVLALAGDMGAPALVLLLLIIGTILWHSLRKLVEARRERDEQFYATALLLEAVGVYLMSAMFIEMRSHRYVHAIMWMILGMLYSRPNAKGLAMSKDGNL